MEPSQLRRATRYAVLVSLMLVVTSQGSRAMAAEPVFSRAVASRLDAAFRNILVTHALPSVAVAVSRPGRTPYVFVGGAADLRTGAPRTGAQPFRIASITKAFVAVAVLQLVEAGRLNKSDTVSRWYPKFPRAAFITVDDLLRMRSGIAAPSDDVVLARVYDRPLARHPSMTEQIAEAAALRAKSIAPNTMGVYTDVNYMLLGEIVRRATGHDVAYYIAKNIVAKLRLRQTSYPVASYLPGGLHGYGWNAATRRFDDKTAFNPALAGPAGAMLSSLSDLGAFARAVCRGGLLTLSHQRAMLAGAPLAGTHVRYGEGVISDAGICGHSGTINGFNTDMYYLSKNDTTLVINVSRLDKDNRAQTTPYLRRAIDALAAPAARP